MTWTCNDLIALVEAAGKTAADLNGADVYIEYTATLNGDAVIGSKGNPNEMHIVYSNTPDGTGHGQNEDDKVIVFTYDLSVNKVDQNEKPLAGAAFALYKKVPVGNSKAVALDKDGKVKDDAPDSEKIWLPVTLTEKAVVMDPGTLPEGQDVHRVAFSNDYTGGRTPDAAVENVFTMNGQGGWTWHSESGSEEAAG